jgi:putative peptidoglycan lipid II flippase
VKPVVQNAGLLLGLFCFLLFRQQQLLAWGFVFGYLVLSVTGLADLRRATSATGFEKDPGAGGLSEGREIREQMWALSFLITITQCGLVGERIITTLAGPGSVAAIDYARFVTETPTLLFAMPAAVVLLSKFSGGEWGDHSEQSTRLCRTLIYATLPFAVGALTAAPLVVSVVFERGAFGKASAGLVAAALSGSALGVVTGSLAYVVQRVFSARQRNRDLLVGLTASTVASLGLALSLVRSQGVVVIGVASSLGQGIYAVWGLHRLGILPGFRSAMIPILCCSGVGALVWIGLRATGAPGLSPWVLLLPACATAACLFAFRAVRSDVAWALPVVRRLRGVPRIPIG